MHVENTDSTVKLSSIFQCEKFALSVQFESYLETNSF